MIKNRTFLLFCAFLLAAYPPLCNGFAIARSILRGARATAYYGLSLSPSLLPIIRLYYKPTINKSIELVTKDSKEYPDVHNIIVNEIGENISVRIGDRYASFPQLIIIPEINSKEEEHQMRSSIHHELSHIKNHDIQKYLILSAIAPFANLALQKVTGNKLPVSFKTSRLGRYRRGIIHGLLNSILIEQLIHAYSRSYEARADEDIPNTEYHINGIKNFLTQEDEIMKEGTPALKSNPFLYYCLDPLHPPYPKRIRRFEERLAHITSSPEYLEQKRKDTLFFKNTTNIEKFLSYIDFNASGMHESLPILTEKYKKAPFVRVPKPEQKYSFAEYQLAAFHP